MNLKIYNFKHAFFIFNKAIQRKLFRSKIIYEWEEIKTYMIKNIARIFYNNLSKFVKILGPLLK